MKTIFHLFSPLFFVASGIALEKQAGGIGLALLILGLVAFDKGFHLRGNSAPVNKRKHTQ